VNSKIELAPASVLTEPLAAAATFIRASGMRGHSSAEPLRPILIKDECLRPEYRRKFALSLIRRRGRTSNAQVCHATDRDYYASDEDGPDKVRAASAAGLAPILRAGEAR
jgi:hypothetical protein